VHVANQYEVDADALNCASDKLTLRVSTCSGQFGWRRSVVVSGVRRMNAVNPRRALLVLGWVTVFRRVYHLGM